MPTVAILGSAGYTGQETLDRVLAHPALELIALGSETLAGRPARALDPRLHGLLPMFTTNLEAATRSMAPDLRTLPSSTYATPSVLEISATVICLPLK